MTSAWLINSAGLCFDIAGFYILFIHVECKLTEPDERPFWGTRPSTSTLLAGSLITFGFFVQLTSNIASQNPLIAAILSLVAGIVLCVYSFSIFFKNKKRLAKTPTTEKELAQSSTNVEYYWKLWKSFSKYILIASILCLFLSVLLWASWSCAE